MDGFLFALTLFAALGCGVIAGVFFAFSAFVMGALARLPARQGIAAMQAINVAAITPAFMVALFGTALACGALIVFVVLGVGRALRRVPAHRRRVVSAWYDRADRLLSRAPQ
jgi:uncharacterized membrane protein